MQQLEDFLPIHSIYLYVTPWKILNQDYILTKEITHANDVPHEIWQRNMNGAGVVCSLEQHTYANYGYASRMNRMGRDVLDASVANFVKEGPKFGPCYFVIKGRKNIVVAGVPWHYFIIVKCF